MKAAPKTGLPSLVLLFLTACSLQTARTLPASTPVVTEVISGETPLPGATASLTAEPSLPAALLPSAPPPATPEPTLTRLPSPTPLPEAIGLVPEEWKTWPIIPIVPESVRAIYALGQQLGNDPHAFSVFGDCQSAPKAFLGIYESDPQAAAALPPELQQTVAYFAGSFNRYSPTQRGGTTAGALLWPDWHQGKYTCKSSESPVTCELRIHRPSFVIIHVGTHYEARNTAYLRQVIEQLIDAGVVPILATKADNREKDEAVNLDYALLAVEYNLPLWNFWAATSALPNRGLYTRPEVRYQGDVYLTDAALQIQRYTALLALNAVWRAVTAGW